MKKVFTCIMVLIITSFSAVAQTYTYHQDDKEGMRIFLRQPSSEAGKINAVQLGLQISDTLTWYNNDAWIPKVTGFTWKLYDYYRVSKIDCSGKKIAGKLNAEKWSRLETLHCYDNKITDIDVSKNVHLNHLACDNNPFNSLNINGAIELRTLYCQQPDDNNKLTSLDLSTNVNLVNLDCSKNKLTELDISNCPALAMLYCNDNLITALDVSKNPNLGTIRCANNQIVEFDASDIFNLVSLDISNNEKLSTLIINDNKLTGIGLNINGNKNIETLYCNNNKLSFINLSDAENLVVLDCSNNVISNLDLTNNTKLEQLYCNNNEIPVLTINKNVNLKHLDCSHNWLLGLDVNNNSKLETLYFNKNQITSININNAINIIEFSCSMNRISKLDVSKNSKLVFLNFSDNKINEIDVRNNVLLETLECSNNELSQLDLSKNNLLNKLNCSGNLLRNLRTIENCQLTFLNCSKNILLFSELFSIKNDKLTTFSYHPQKVYIDTNIYTFSGMIDISTEYNINGVITDFSWGVYVVATKKTIPITLKGENGIFVPPQIDLSGKTLRCKMYNGTFPDLTKKDSLTYEVTITGVGINEMETIANIYPNPTTGKVVIENVAENIETIQLFDISGRMVFETRFTQFDISHLPTATYFIQIRTNEGILTRKITKQ